MRRIAAGKPDYWDHATLISQVAYYQDFVKPAKRYRIAYLAECISNPYCQTRLRGMKAAAKRIAAM